MSAYTLQGKKADGQMVDIPLAAQYDGDGRDISATYATKTELAQLGTFDPSGSYPSLTAGNATEAASADKADADGAGNNIQTTYATKAEVGAKADQSALEDVVDGTTPVAKASTADSATAATKATQDGSGNVIATTYATKTEVGAKADQSDLDDVIDGTTPVAKATSADTATNAGHATKADHATNADEATNATYAQTASTADTAGYATTAKGDANGNDIAATYALKSEVGAKKYLHLVNMSTTSQDSEYKFLGIAKIINNSSAAFTTTTLQQFLDGKAVEARGTFAIYKQPLDYMYEAFSIEGEGDSFTVYGGLRALGEPRYSPSGFYIDGKATIEYSRIDSSRFRDDVTEL